MYLKKLRNMGRKQHSLLLQSCVKWDVKFREQGMLNDHPRRCFHKITLKNWRMLCYISSVRATLHILRQLSQVRSGQLLQESKSAHWFQLSRQLWAKKVAVRSKTDASPSAMICWEKVPHWPSRRTKSSTQRLVPQQLLLLTTKACS